MTISNSLTARLYENDVLICSCPVNYLGLLGMQVDVEGLDEAGLANGKLLQVELLDTNRDGHHRCRLPVVVTNLSPVDMGLSFLRHDMKTNAILLEMILAGQLGSPANENELVFESAAG